MQKKNTINLYETKGFEIRDMNLHATDCVYHFVYYGTQHTTLKANKWRPNQKFKNDTTAE